MALVGRDRELEQLDRWLSGSAGERPRPVLLIEGEAGIGKTELWSEALVLARERGCRVLSCRTSPSESKLSYVGLTDLLRPYPDTDFEALPELQRRPLEVALLRADSLGSELDPRAVGTGFLGLLEVLARDAPLILAIDDGHWLDAASARVLTFAFRRADDIDVRLLVTVRTGEARRATGLSFSQLEREIAARSIERLQVTPLSVAAVNELIRQLLGASIARPVLVRIHTAASGNPFYALEIAREVLRRGSVRPGEPLPVPADHQEVVLLRLRRLPRRTRQALLLMAAHPRPRVGDVDEVALAPALRAGIARVEPPAHLAFTHPLFGSVLYSSVPPQERQDVHRLLAERAETLEEQALHSALGAPAPDRETADLLDRATDAALRRGAADTAVELKELACRLTPEGNNEATLRRRLELADRRYFAGDATGARLELESLLTERSEGEDRARVLLELGSVLWTQGAWVSGLDLLSEALEAAESTPLRARIHSRMSSFAVDCDYGLEHAEAALGLIDENEDPMLYSFALHNMAMWKLYARGIADHAAIERGIELQREAAAWEMSTVPAVWARLFDDLETARRLHEDLLSAFKQAGDMASTAGILSHLAAIESMRGHAERARALADEAFQLALQTEQATYVTLALRVRGYVAAQAGELEEARRAAGEVLQRIEEQPDPIFEAHARGVLGLAALAGDDAAEADRQLTRVEQILAELHTREPAADRVQADHAEAVIQLGQLERAEQLVAAMEQRAQRLPRPWICAVSARARGLLRAAQGDLDRALEDLQRALVCHADLDMPIERGRTLLCLGRLRRRRGERSEAQQCLEEAVATFETSGAGGWAERARHDLERASSRRGDRDELTTTELSVAELAASGLRNEDIAAQLFITTKTVEANLTRIYRKLGIRSRASLERQLTARRVGRAEP